MPCSYISLNLNNNENSAQTTSRFSPVSYRAPRCNLSQSVRDEGNKRFMTSTAERRYHRTPKQVGDGLQGRRYSTADGLPAESGRGRSEHGARLRPVDTSAHSCSGTTGFLTRIICPIVRSKGWVLQSCFM
jgi:hypothetical protein